MEETQGDLGISRSVSRGLCRLKVAVTLRAEEMD